MKEIILKNLKEFINKKYLLSEKEFNFLIIKINIFFTETDAMII
jgi:hypothetical protein